MTVFLLIRHALHELGGETIAGRLPGVHLSPDGRAQAAELAERLRELPIKAIYSSPLDRTCETASYLSGNVEPSAEIQELDFGDWMGQRLDALRPQEKWRQFNSFRSGTRAPNGELMLETQVRIVTFMMRLRERHPFDHVALVSHGDVIKSAVAYFLGIPLDLFQRVEISPASVSMIAIGDYGPWVHCINHTGALPRIP
ncbi:histidine phosphatase family protein [Fimbriimonas ginsengisoli]|uniref:Phosphoglycerate mutase n=1 Tax=Fimbriimonas ginsengisoli Gsoil 348 TaxID=661478 RepID=A0A068NTC0_FIMGI|nr:histidine phosphatase family protein [Fimbriimonas ginsengisoli]AIE86681.1 Phosphoglycerate mutase [Fimbriimonas ginsengisoli Gsoil 348]